jgi:hypothetical protein
MRPDIGSADVLKAAALVMLLTISPPVLAQQGAVPPFVARVGAYVEGYYDRTQRILVEETVVMQPLRSDLSPDGFGRQVVYETRLEWNPAADEPASVRREVVRTRGPALGPPGQPDCYDDRGISPEPLAFLLPARQPTMRFQMAGAGRVGERAALLLDYRPIKEEPAKVTWNEQCGEVDLSGRTRGRVWADPNTGAVLKLSEWLIGPEDFRGPTTGRTRNTGPLWFTAERADTTIEYREVRFTGPDETLLLPWRVDSVSVIVRSGLPRLRVTQTYTNYRRFLTESKIVLPE